MADNNQNLGNNIEDAKKRIKELDAEIKRLGGEGFKNIDQFVQSLGNNLENATRQVKLMEGEVDDLKNTFSNIATTLKNIVADINGSVKTSTLLTRNFNKLEDLANKIQRHREDENILTVKELKEIEKKVAKEKESLDTNLKQAKYDKERLERDIKSGNLKASQLASAKEELRKITEYESEILDAKADQESYYNTIVEKTTAQRKEEERIQKSLGLTGSIVGGITKTLEKVGIQSKYFEDINKDLREAAKEAGSSQWSVLGKGLGSLGKGLMTALKDPLVQLTLIYKVAKSLFDVGMAYSKTIAETGKNYALSADGAKALVSYTRDVAANSNSLAVNNQSALEATNQLNDAFGTTAILSSELIEGQVKLTDKLGLQADEAAKISEFALLQGKSQEDILKDITGQTKGLANNRKVIAEVAKTSGQLALFYQNSPGLIAKAVVQAQKLGMSLEQTKGISDALLDIESSLANEYEAEALIGRDLNLNRARQLALEGDVAGAAEEVLKNIKGSAEFSQMNRIQQDALAKSLGMSSDELAKSLIHQEKLSKLGTQQKNELAKLRAEGKSKLADDIEAGIIQGKSYDLSKAQVSASHKFEESVTKIKDGFSSLIAGPMGMMVDGLASAVGFVSQIFSFLGQIPGAGTLGSLISVVIGGGALIAGGMLLIKSLSRSIVNMFKGKPSGRQGDELHVIVDNPSTGEAAGGGGRGGGRRGRRGRTRRAGRGRFGAAAALAGGLGMDMLAGEDETGLLDTGADIASSTSPGGGASTPSTAPKSGGGVGKAASKGGGFFGKIGSFFSGIGGSIAKGAKSLGKGALDMAAGPVKGALKVVGKFLGPIIAAVEGVTSVAGVISDAKAKKAAGETVDTSMLGKDIMKGAAYPIANLLLNLIPGVGTALSLADAALGAFGLSPIKWLSDNLINWLPDDTFKGLGEFAVGEQKAMAEGGIVTGPTNALVGEAGAEAVIPLREFYAKIDELINAVKQGGNIYLDGAAISTKLQSPMAIATRRTG